jgi:hypothetical protein
MNLATAARDGFEPAATILLNAGARPNDPRQYYSALSPLYWAAKEGNTGVMDVLLAHGANADWKEQAYPRWSPLHAAAANGHAGAIKSLVSAGANINALAGDGDPPLIQAVLCGHADCARALIDAGADPSIRSSKYGSAAEISVQKGLSDISAALRDKDKESLTVRTSKEAGQAPLASNRVDGRCIRLCIILSRFVSVRALLTVPFLPFVRYLSFCTVSNVSFRRLYWLRYLPKWSKCLRAVIFRFWDGIIWHRW